MLNWKHIAQAIDAEIATTKAHLEKLEVAKRYLKPSAPKRQLSLEARSRIAAAQRARWAKAKRKA